MRLYTRTGATALTDPATGKVYEADEQGGFDFPDEVSDQIHKFAVRGKPQWENDIERQRRLLAEEAERRRDPATLLSTVEQIVKAAQGTKAAEPEPAKGTPTKRASKRSASAPAD